MPAAITAQIDELVALKSRTNEAAPASRSRDLEALITSELDRANEVPERLNRASFEQEAEALFFDLIAV